MAVCKLIQNSQTKFKLKKNRVLYGRVQKALGMGVTYNSENYFIPHYQDGVAWSGGATLPRWQLSGFTPSNLGKVTKWSLLFATWSRVEYDVDPPDEHLTVNTYLCGVSQLTNMKLWDRIFTGQFYPKIWRVLHEVIPERLKLTIVLLYGQKLIGMKHCSNIWQA